jgi:hypothetical protein
MLQASVTRVHKPHNTSATPRAQVLCAIVLLTAVHILLVHEMIYWLSTAGRGDVAPIIILYRWHTRGTPRIDHCH